jgi:hypothetical protein
LIKNTEDKAMQKQFEEIEQKLTALYTEIQKEIPEVRCLDLAVSQIDKTSDPYLYGFLHVGDDCKTFRSLAEVYNLWHKHQILFQKFDHVL